MLSGNAAPTKQAPAAPEKTLIQPTANIAENLTISPFVVNLGSTILFKHH